ncbi:hypothetical protein E1A91_A01G214200v1 [Gossypium mustelinum]|uniref:Uncharacterized protein n=1 Tax=Gossypium mustelinum TaxID=34275 RepID=A0A5D3AFY7_GOSMU|nr:hypothetical protein E1A91_A01G214200v1 [Gossypium mustelinum]
MGEAMARVFKLSKLNMSQMLARVGGRRKLNHTIKLLIDI